MLMRPLIAEGANGFAGQVQRAAAAGYVPTRGSYQGLCSCRHGGAKEAVIQSRISPVGEACRGWMATLAPAGAPRIVRDVVLPLAAAMARSRLSHQCLHQAAAARRPCACSRLWAIACSRQRDRTLAMPWTSIRPNPRFFILA